jgi:hypothetical protein
MRVFHVRVRFLTIALAIGTLLVLVHPSSAQRVATSRRLAATETSGQRLSVEVPVGSLSVTNSSGVVVLRRMGVGNGRSIYRGTLSNVRVIEMRASLPGWNVSVSFSAPGPTTLDGAVVRARPGEPVVVSGDAEGVTKAHPSWTELEEEVPLFGAAIGFGRGTYEDGADVELALATTSSFKESTIMLAVSVVVV